MEYPGLEDAEAYQRVVVQHEDPEAEAASLGALLAEAVECDDEEEERSATMIPCWSIALDSTTSLGDSVGNVGYDYRVYLTRLFQRIRSIMSHRKLSLEA